MLEIVLQAGRGSGDRASRDGGPKARHQPVIPPAWSRLRSGIPPESSRDRRYRSGIVLPLRALLAVPPPATALESRPWMCRRLRKAHSIRRTKRSRNRDAAAWFRDLFVLRIL